jgi:hypothetical protein
MPIYLAFTFFKRKSILKAKPDTSLTSLEIHGFYDFQHHSYQCRGYKNGDAKNSAS